MTNTRDYPLLVRWTFTEPETLLDATAKALESRMYPTSAVMESLMSGLFELRKTLEKDEWKRFAHRAKSNRVSELLNLDPFTRHAVTRPRGYPGDAALLDFIYLMNTHPDLSQTSALGLEIYDSNIREPSCRAVRSRAQYLAREIQRVPKDGRILAVACGHARELDLISNESNEFSEFVAIDQDPLTISALMQKAKSQSKLKPFHGKISDLIAGRLDLGTFDLIYATGLYDYLPDRKAKQLTATLLQLANKGGKIVITNFLPEILGAGYMEVFMDWWLLFRSPADTRNLFVESQQGSRLSSLIDVTEPNGNIVYVEGRLG